MQSTLTLTIPKKPLSAVSTFLQRYIRIILVIGLSIISIIAFIIYYRNGLGLAYNDARSHLDIGRRVVEGLKPGLAQLGSVWLPLNHVLMIPTIWNDFMWHSGLSGAIQSMVSFVATSLFIYEILRKLKVGLVGRLFGVAVFVLNNNILYLQSTAMTELLLIATMTAAVLEMITYHQDDSILTLIRAAIWIMLATLIRYDGWFLFFMCIGLVVTHAWKKKGYKMSEGMFFLFCTLAGLGIFLWVLWNAVIFRDPLYFAFGPYSAHAQQAQLASAGVLLTQHNWVESTRSYWFAMLYNSGAFSVILAALGSIILFFDQKISRATRFAATALFAPLIFNIMALYFGFSVLFVQGINGDTWFNVRYGVMMMPSIAIFMGFLADRIKIARWVIIGLFCFVTFFAFVSHDAVTVDDGRVGSSQKNVSEVSGWLHSHVANQKGFVLISAASHDAIIFSSGLPMTRFIHEGTGAYWFSATTAPDRWARWIVMRTNDPNDQTFKLLSKTKALPKYTLMKSYPFADIYQLKDQYLPTLHTTASLGRQK